MLSNGKIKKKIYFRNDIVMFEGDGNVDDNEYGNLIVKINVHNLTDLRCVGSDIYKHLYINKNKI